MLDFLFKFRAEKSRTDTIQVTPLTELIKLKSERGQKMNFNQFK